MPVMYQKWIQRSDLKLNREVLYLFGDNDARTGYGGQAKECRGEPNAVGIRTKKRPSKDDSAFYNDVNYEQNIKKIDDDMNKAIAHLRKGKTVVIPSDGIGTNRAAMESRCPKTFEYLLRRLDSLLYI